MKQIACGRKDFSSPPFPFPPPGASRGHHRLRYATARALRRPKAERSSAFWAGKESAPFLGATPPPKPPLSGARESVNFML